MEEHSFLRYSLAVLLFLAISTQAQRISPKYDRADRKLKVIETRGPLVLECQFDDQQGSSNELEWTRNGVAVSADPVLANRHQVYRAEKKFVIEKPTDGDAGNYTCTIKGTKESASFWVLAMIRARLPSNSAVVEEEKLTLHCVVVGTDPEITWTIQDNITITESHNRYILKEDDNKVKNAILVINEAMLSDRGNYTCEVTNEVVRLMDKYQQVTTVTYLRVKGKYAALWPFLGICAEVVILCAIIIIYEKRRNKADLEESDTDQSPEQKSDHKEADVRQRK